MITVLFSCDECGLEDAVCRVPAREDPNVDVQWWMNDVVVPAVHGKHRLLSPVCGSEQMTNLKIPMGKTNDPDRWLGKQTTDVPPKGRLDAQAP